jgi:uncharacterized protein
MTRYVVSAFRRTLVVTQHVESGFTRTILREGPPKGGRHVRLGVVATLIALAQSPAIADYPIRAVPLTSVRLTDEFWRPRLERNRTVTIPHILHQNELTGRIDNFLKAAHKMEGPYRGQRYNDTDVYKIIEAASYSLQVHPDPALDAKLDELIGIIAAAQEPDGYLYTPRTVDPKNPAPGAGPERWSWLHTSHELYDQGHMIEAAVAHFQATGKRSLLTVAIKSADLMCRVFGPDGRREVPGHEEIELALVKLYRITGERKYLDQAKRFLDERGREHTTPPVAFEAGSRFGMYNDLAYRQDHKPVVDQTQAVGHAVRATYLYAGMIDAATLLGDAKYGDAVETLWQDVSSKRMYLTGGLGSDGRNEAFGGDYLLPHRAYAETCASIGGMLWYHRMFLRHGDAKYYDTFERTLYNGYLSGVSLAGDTFFYQNPLVSNGSVERSVYFDVACCPANLARLMAQLPGLMYAQRDRDLYVNLFAASQAEVTIGSAGMRLTQETRYPWDGDIVLRIDPDGPTEATLAIRIPGWARGEAMPTDLYRFADRDPERVALQPNDGSTGVARPVPASARQEEQRATARLAEAPEARRRQDRGGQRSKPSLRLNGRPVPMTLDKGYARIRRRWQKGDVVQLDLPMPIRRVLAHDGVAEDRDKAAIERGPIVYCVEAIDNNGRVADVRLPLDAPLSHRFDANLLDGVEVVRSDTLVAVPYYAWANRGKGEMAVWIPYK